MTKANRIICYIFLILTIVLDVFIIAESCVGGVNSSTQSQGFTQAVIQFVEAINPESKIGNNPDQVHAIIRKVAGHFLLFGLSGLISFVPLLMVEDALNKHKSEIIIVFIFKGFFIACLTETIQYFIPGRAGMFSDILIDFSGYLLFGFILFFILLGVNNAKQRKKFELTN